MGAAREAAEKVERSCGRHWIIQNQGRTLVKDGQSISPQGIHVVNEPTCEVMLGREMKGDEGSADVRTVLLF